MFDSIQLLAMFYGLAIAASMLVASAAIDGDDFPD